MKTRFSDPPAKYDQRDEAGFRRAVQEALQQSGTEFDEIRIAGGVLFGQDGNLKFRSAHNTVTTVGPL